MPIFGVTHPAFRFWPFQTLLVLVCAFASLACTRPASHYFVDALVSSAHRPSRLDSHPPAPYQILAGDLHCHVTPPDSPYHVSRNLAETIDLARGEKLDFVVLTPHLRAQFFLDSGSRASAVGALNRLEHDVSQLDHAEMLVFVGFEYTDFDYGHVGAAFGNLNEVLANLAVEQAEKNPGAFFEAYVASNGLLFINHPLVTPLDYSIEMANVDLSWRPLIEPRSYPSEIAAANRLAHGFEAFNLTVFELRDRFLLSDPQITLRRTLTRLDQEILAQHRRLIPVGGSDSHSDHLRAATFVMAEHKSPRAIREAMLAGRVCIRDPAACTFEAREPGGAWMPIGSSFQNVEQLEVRAQGNDVHFIVNGSLAYHGSARKTMPIRVNKGRCSLLRAQVDEGYSAPIYANCAF
ncbi:MAG TPA: hypothetical protein PK156_32075 [Polyangium sp.]|nr:hypothetical protein [Polyangium sp.]